MGELVTEKTFLDRYAAHHGKLPPSYYLNRTADVEGFTPSAGEMGYFLDRGDIWADDPWRGVKYNIPPNRQEDVFHAIMDLSPDYKYTVIARRGRGGEIIGAKTLLVSDYADERGRPVVEGILDEMGRIRQVVYRRRRVRISEERPAHPNVIHRSRREDFVQKERG